MDIEKNNLFSNTREFLLVSSVLIAVILIRLLFLYQEYKEFLDKPFFYTTATILEQYTKSKNNRKYTILKLKTKDGYLIYTISNIKQNIRYHRVRVKIIIDKNLIFKDYLGSFYSQVIIREIYSKIENRQKLVYQYIASQHINIKIQSFYSAIFLATPLIKELRDDVSKLGINHLVALSGFHLAILWGIIFGSLNILYRPFQQNFFPYRYNLIDLGFITIIILSLYLWFVGYPPSLVRSLAMVVSAWIAIILGVRFVSFKFLAVIVLLLLSLNPNFIISISFWFSVAGVFYIYLILKYSLNSYKLLISIIYIPFGIFILMLPIVHIFFQTTNPYQLLSPLLSILFTIFYPLSLMAHILNIGWIFDDILLFIFSLANSFIDNILPQDIVLPYIISSIFSIWSRLLFMITLFMAILYGTYLFWSIF